MNWQLSSWILLVSHLHFSKNFSHFHSQYITPTNILQIRYYWIRAARHAQMLSGTAERKGFLSSSWLKAFSELHMPFSANSSSSKWKKSFYLITWRATLFESHLGGAVRECVVRLCEVSEEDGLLQCTHQWAVDSAPVVCCAELRCHLLTIMGKVRTPYYIHTKTCTN